MKPRNLLGLAEVATRRGEFEQARQLLEQARTLADEGAVRPLQAQAALVSGALEAAQGNYAGALAQLNDAETRAAEMQLRPLVLEARLRAVECLNALGGKPEADAMRAAARSAANEMAGSIPDAGVRRAYLNAVMLRLEPETVT
jgi:ATP/maltotriose-dependent transcriptional regulator MalT